MLIVWALTTWHQQLEIELNLDLITLMSQFDHEESMFLRSIKIPMFLTIYNLDVDVNAETRIYNKYGWSRQHLYQQMFQLK